MIALALRSLILVGVTFGVLAASGLAQPTHLPASVAEFLR